MKFPNTVPGAVPAVLLLIWAACGGAAQGAEPHEDPRLSRAMSRCTQLAELIACYDALNRQPNNPDLLVAEADALLRLRRAGEAIGVYRNALTVGANRDVVNPKIAGARALRRSLLDTCLKRAGVAAERACESAWLPGAADEVAVFKRRGVLLGGEGEPSAALDAYLSAARLAPRDRAVARAIVALSASTGRRDASTLHALTAARDQLRAAERAVAANATSGASPAGMGSAASGTVAGAADGGEGVRDTYSNDAAVSRSN